MASRKILLVDDDRQMLEAVRRYLENRDYTVVFTDNGSEALLMARETKPDIIVTDAHTPGMGGFELCELVKKSEDTAHIPVIIISGTLTEEDDVLAGYEKGADDYVLKPFSYAILNAKINSVLRRYSAPRSRPGATAAGIGLRINPAARTVSVKGREVNLTRKEFDLLTLLLEKKGRVLGVPYILETVWGYDPARYNDPHTVEVHISSLKKKLGVKPASHIKSMTGHGYKFE